MSVQRLKRKNGETVAFIYDKGKGIQCIHKLNGSLLGWYRPNASGGITTDQNGRLIGQGNVLASLVADLL
jgi:hypothetical protein